MDPLFQSYFIAMLGSFAVEIVNIVRVHESGKQLAARYKRPTFLVSRFLLAVLAGLMASLVYRIENPILAFHIGITAPLLVQAIERSPASNEDVRP